MSVTIAPQSGKYDLGRDLQLWLVQNALTSGGDANFVDGENADESQQSGKIHLFAAFRDDLPNDAGVVTAGPESPLFEFAPVKTAECSVLLRIADSDAGSGRLRAQAAAQALHEFLRTSGSQSKTHQTLPSGRVVLIFMGTRIVPGGYDPSGRYEVLVEFVVNYRDDITQT